MYVGLVGEWRDAAEAPPQEGSHYLGLQHRYEPQMSVPLALCLPEGEASAPLLPPGKEFQKSVFCHLEDILLSPSSLLPHPELPLHQVSSSDHLRDRMLHLQPGVHLHEIKVVLGIHNELHRTCTVRQTERWPFFSLLVQKLFYCESGSLWCDECRRVSVLPAPT